MVGLTEDESELLALELIHALVEALDEHFGAVCELDLMHGLADAHAVVDDVISASGLALEAGCRPEVLRSVRALAAAAREGSTA